MTFTSDPIVEITLTLPNGSKHSVRYSIAGGPDRAAILFETLKDAAWAASTYVADQPELRFPPPERGRR